MDKQKAIENIIENFDFVQVNKVMEFLDWKWKGEGVPSLGKLIITAQKFLSEVYDDTNERCESIKRDSGGFIVESMYSKEEGCCDYLELRFELESWDYFDEN